MSKQAFLTSIWSRTEPVGAVEAAFFFLLEELLLALEEFRDGGEVSLLAFDLRLGCLDNDDEDGGGGGCCEAANSLLLSDINC
jgi:hypothetical protein